MSGNRDPDHVAVGPIPPSKPPVSEVGVIRWLRRNLFNSAFDGILTLILIAVIASLMLPLVDWAFLKGVWNANSLEQCREIVAATHGEGARGACWAVINKNSDLLLFGLYPPQLHWRPVLAFVLFFVALAPVLFRSVPQRMLWFSAIYPIIAYILIWGGFGLEIVDSVKIGGFLLAILIAVTGIAIAIPFGFVLAFGRQFAIFPIKTICMAFAEFLRGVPLIVLMYTAAVMSIFFMPPNTRIDRILWYAFLLALHSGVYIAEAIRRCLEALPRGQWEAAAALRLSYPKTIWLIILPQALKIAAPQIVHTCIGLFRDTTLVSVVVFLGSHGDGVLNPIRASSAWNGILWELFAVLALFYWVFGFLMSRYALTFREQTQGQPQMAHRS